MPGHGSELYGQNTISQSSYSLESGYQQAINNRLNARGLAMADSLYAIAVETGDKDMQCKLLAIPVHYYFYTNNEEKLTEACENLRRAARADNDERRLYWSYSQLSMYLMRHDKIFEAVEVAEQMKNDAEATKSYLGMYMTYLTLGNVYKAREDTELAKDSYQKALDLQKQYLKDVDATMIRVNLSEIYRRRSGRTEEDINMAKQLIDDGLEETTDTMNIAHLLSEKAMIYHSQKDYGAFNDTYRRLLTQFESDTLPDDFIQVAYRKKILDGDYDGAIQLIGRIPSDYDKHIALYLLYKGKEDYKNAISEYEKANHVLNAIRSKERGGYVEKLYQTIGNLQLEKENSELKAQEAENDKKFSTIIGGVMLVIFIVVLVALYFVVKLWNQARKAGDELKDKNHELEQARDEAIRSERMKTMFIQNMSHEIRTPLNAIVGFSDILATQTDELDESDREEFKNLIQHNNEVLTRLVNDILTLSDLDSGKYEMDITKVNVNRLCKNVLQSVKHRAHNNVALNYDTDLSDKFEIETDDARLNQVLTNLLVNACKYTTNGSITLECRLKGSQIVFAVTDTGPGIPADRRVEIFERFTKLDNFHQGTGLGLNICRTIVDMLKGKIFIDDRYVGGSRFVVELPVFYN